MSGLSQFSSLSPSPWRELYACYTMLASRIGRLLTIIFCGMLTFITGRPGWNRGPQMDETEQKKESRALVASKGGNARAESLPADRRVEIARQAAASRWSQDAPRA